MLKKISFYIASTFSSLFSKGQKFSLDDVSLQARKSEYVYNGIYNLTGEILQLAEATPPGKCQILYYLQEVADTEEIHLFILTNKKVFHFNSTLDPEIEPTGSAHKANEVPVLLQLEFLARKKQLTATHLANLHMYIDGVTFDESEAAQAAWDTLAKFVKTKIAHSTEAIIQNKKTRK